MSARVPLTWPAALVVGALAASACASSVAPPASMPGAATPPAERATPPAERAALPEADELLPTDVEAATAWMPMSSLPSGFETTGYASADELVDAFGGAILAGWAGSRERPEIRVDVLGESADQALAIVSEVGVPDDSVAGTQYALLMRGDDSSWSIEELWTRALCRRGTVDELCV